MGVEPKQPARSTELMAQTHGARGEKREEQVKKLGQKSLISAKMKAVGIRSPGRDGAAGLLYQHEHEAGWRRTGAGRQIGCG